MNCCHAVLFFGWILQRPEISSFAAGHKTFGDGFQFFPALADLFGFSGRDLIIGSRRGDDGEQIGKFLDNLIRGGNQKIGMRQVGFGIQDEKSACALAKPLDKAMVFGAFEERFDAVKWIGCAAAGCGFRWLGPFVNHGSRKAEVGGDLLG